MLAFGLEFGLAGAGPGALSAAGAGAGGFTVRLVGGFMLGALELAESPAPGELLVAFAVLATAPAFDALESLAAPELSPFPDPPLLDAPESLAPAPELASEPEPESLAPEPEVSVATLLVVSATFATLALEASAAPALAPELSAFVDPPLPDAPESFAPDPEPEPEPDAAANDAGPPALAFAFANPTGAASPSSAACPVGNALY